MITLQKINDEDVTSKVASEIARVGIVPRYQKEPIGFRFVLAGQPFTVVGHTTREKFYEALEREGMALDNFLSVPDSASFTIISTD